MNWRPSANALALTFVLAMTACDSGEPSEAEIRQAFSEREMVPPDVVHKNKCVVDGTHYVCSLTLFGMYNGQTRDVLFVKGSDNKWFEMGFK